jgi:MFS superfamily sulfate permease-like transporter
VSEQTAAGTGDQAERGEVPKDWMPGLRENWRSDVLSGFIVFLLAVPLSLGIALASGVPPFAGIITAIVGGMFVSLTSGSHVTINGAAAGLIVIVLGAVEGLGEGDAEAGYRFALAVGVVAGALQIVCGLLRAGKVTNFFPLSVVHGMLAGIGVIIISRQFHVAVGVEGVSGHGLDPITEIPNSIGELNFKVAVIGLVAVLIMVFWPMLKRAARFLPAPLVAAIAGVVLGAAFGLPDRFLINLPDSFSAGFITPDFSRIFELESFRWVIAFLFVASLESLLTASAVDKLDPWKRRSDMNREFLGKGSGNMVSCMIGGLPMIAEVVRSTANILNGARTRWSNFFHGFFVLVFVAIFPGVLQLIPLSALAGILVVVGWKLFNLPQFAEALRIGRDELLFMIVTITIVVYRDLLEGVIAGIIVGLVVALVRGTRLGNLFRPALEVSDDGAAGETVVTFRRRLGFTNFVGVRSRLDELPQGKTVVLDFSGVEYVDHTVVERLHDFEPEYEREGGRVVRRGMDHLEHATEHPLSALVSRRTASGSTA